MLAQGGSGKWETTAREVEKLYVFHVRVSFRQSKVPVEL